MKYVQTLILTAETVNEAEMLACLAADFEHGDTRGKRLDKFLEDVKQGKR